MSIEVIVVEPKPGTQDALVEIQEILRTVAASGSTHRLAAVRFTHCRSVLLQSEYRSALPGFLIQCVSLYKFQDFISLYDPKPEARVAFVNDAFAKWRSGAKARVYDIFSDPDF